MEPVHEGRIASHVRRQRREEVTNGRSSQARERFKRCGEWGFALAQSVSRGAR
jgi:hypothetical protein